MPETSYGGPKPSGGLSFGLPDLGLGGSGGVAVPADGYGVPAAPVVASNGGSDGYGAPSNEGYGPSSAVSPFSQQAAQSSSNYGAPPAPAAPANNYAAAAPSAPANDFASAEPALDSYGAPQADPISSGSSAPVVSEDEYGAPAAPVVTASAEPVAVVAAAPAVDDYSSPVAPVIQAAPAASVSSSVALKAEVPAADDYSSPQASVIQSAPADTYNEPSSYAAIPSEPVINDNSFDSYGSPRSPAPSSYDAPAVPAGNKRVIRRWYHQLY